MRIFRNKRVYIVCGLLVATFFSIQLMSSPAIAADWSWNKAKPTVFSSVAASPPESWCQTAIFEIHYIAGEINPVNMCMMQNQKVRFGLYYDGNYGYLAAIGFGNDSLMYKIDGDCAQIGECLYLPDTDMMVKKEYLTNTALRSLVVYQNFSQHLQRHFDVVDMANRYSFDDSGSKYIFRRDGDNNKPYLVGSLSASNNGKWLAIEIYSNGLALLNLDTFQVRVVSSISYEYGMGYSPRVELAVSNDGAHFAVMGVNASIYWFDVNDNCSVMATDRNVLYARFLSLCRPSAFLFFSYIVSPKDGLSPHFSDDGGELDFFMTSTDSTVSPRKVALRAAGYPAKKLDYLALGDSYSSGEGEIDDTHYLVGTNSEYEKCHISDRSYPFELAKMIGIDQDAIRSVACSGATMPDLIGNDEKYYGQGDRLGVNGLQLNDLQLASVQSLALSQFIPGRVHQASFVQLYQPSAITVGIGGNDAGFMEKLSGCLGPITCKWASTDEGREKTAIEIKNLFGTLVSTYTNIHNKSPDSKIFAIGYPKIIDSQGRCNSVVSILFDSVERKFITDSILYLNQVIASAAAAANVKFVDIYDAFGENIICGSGSQKAINAVMLGDDIGLLNNFRWLRMIGQESFHPNPFGHQLTAKMIFDKSDNLGDGIGSMKSIASGIAPEPPTSLLPDGYHDYPLQKSASFANLKSADVYDLNLPQYSFEPNSLVRFEVESNLSTQLLYASGDGSIEASITVQDRLQNGAYVIHLVGVSFSGEPIDYYQVIFRVSADTGIEVPDNNSQTSVSVTTGADSVVSDAKPLDTNTDIDKPEVTDIGFGYLASAGLDDSEVMGMETVKMVAAKRPKTELGYNWAELLIGLGLFVTCAIIWTLFKLKSRSSIGIDDNHRKR